MPLHLCSHCKRAAAQAEKNAQDPSSFARRVSHHKDVWSLKKSAIDGCANCRYVYQELIIAEDYRDNPPTIHWGQRLLGPSALMEFFKCAYPPRGALFDIAKRGYHDYVYGKHYRELNTNLGSDESFDIAQNWIRVCDEEHQCYQGNKTTLPPRVLNVSKPDPVLQINKSTKARYITLSHCWGGKQPLTTTTASINDRKTKIPFESLPTLYQDAATIARRLGIDYLWIDSLCILQDSKQDWSRHANMMGEIYRRSYLTIFPLDSQDCHQGILRERVCTRTSEAYTGLERSQQDALEDSVLCKRAWAVQERLLSSRILYYSRKEMFWECLIHRARESSYKTAPNRPNPHSLSRNSQPFVKSRLVSPQKLEPISPVLTNAYWFTIVMEYTKCSLTFLSDNLPALSGVASALQKNTGHKYLAGLWDVDLAEGLLWYIPHERNPPLQRPSDQLKLLEPTTSSSSSLPQGPSWSWTSTNMPVENRALTHWTSQPLPSPRDLKYNSSDVEILDADNPLGRVGSATVKVWAHIADILISANISSSVEDITDDKIDVKSRSVKVFNGNKEWCGSGMLDGWRYIEDHEVGKDGSRDEKYRDSEKHGSEEMNKMTFQTLQGKLLERTRAIWLTRRKYRDDSENLLYFLIVVPRCGIGVEEESGFKDDRVEESKWERIGLGWAASRGQEGLVWSGRAVITLC